ncbi:MAG: chromosomal replication initiator DnaA [Paracoccaceae bacterium]
MTGGDRKGRQLAFDLPVDVAQTRADFFVSPANAVALAAVDGWRDWPQGRMLLTGPPGAGKTHLAQIWAEMAEAEVVAARALGGADLPGLAAGRAVVVEDAHDLPRGAEAALFHLHNLLAGTGHLLLTAALPPRDWGTALPDLVSRMQAMPVTRLEAPDDALLAAVLVKLFADRQITVPANLISYLTQRMDRSLHAARVLVAALDARALALGRPVTRALAAEVLDLDAGA